jgi:peptidyl-prolyl cis-trans isomerase SurA
MIRSTLKTVLFALSMAIAPVAPMATAQSPFSAAIKIDETVVTRYELDQRIRFLTALNFPGVPSQVAREQLIDEKLKRRAAKEAGVILAPEALSEGLTAFAARGNLDLQTFVSELSKAGIDRYTMEQFVETNLLWIEFVRGKFGRQSRVTDAQLERSVKSDKSGTAVEVLLTEIIMGVTQFNQDDVAAKAAELSRIRSIDAFSQAAREYSDAPTRDLGGLVTWQKLDSLPPVLQPLVFGLAPGEVTEPLVIPNAIALFQMRGIRETAYSAPGAGALDYARYSVPSDQAAQLDRIIADTVHCDDLYAWAKGNPDHTLDRQSQIPSKLPQGLKKSDGATG